MTLPPHLPLGFGASGPIGQPWFSEAKAIQLIQTALEAGVRHFDTAGFYQGGTAESRLGSALAKARAVGLTGASDVVVSTKVGKRLGEDGSLIRAMDAESIEAAIANSLQRLAVQALDIVYVHGPDKHELSSVLSILKQHKSNGTLKSIGVCSDGDDLAHAASIEDVDVLMGRYSLFDRRHEQIFRTAKNAGKKVVAIAPLGQALWSWRRLVPTRPSEIWYTARALMRDETRAALKEARNQPLIPKIEGWKPAEICMAYVAHQPMIDVALTTSTRFAHIKQSAHAVSRPLPEGFSELIEAALLARQAGA